MLTNENFSLENIILRQMAELEKRCCIQGYRSNFLAYCISSSYKENFVYTHAQALHALIPPFVSVYTCRVRSRFLII